MRIVETFDVENFGKVAKISAKIIDIAYQGRDGRYKVSCDRCCFNKSINTCKKRRKRFCTECRVYIEERDINCLDSMETIYFVRLTATNINKL